MATCHYLLLLLLLLHRLLQNRLFTDEQESERKDVGEVVAGYHVLQVLVQYILLLRLCPIYSMYERGSSLSPSQIGLASLGALHTLTQSAPLSRHGVYPDIPPPLQNGTELTAWKNGKAHTGS